MEFITGNFCVASCPITPGFAILDYLSGLVFLSIFSCGAEIALGFP